MKRWRVLGISLLWIGMVGFTSTDYTCLNDCTNQGMLYAYCQAQCGYDTPLSRPLFGRNIDYTCVEQCTRQGYLYQYCQQVCQY